MKLFLTSLLLTALSGGASGGVVEKKSGARYSHLWTNSPFTQPKREKAEPTLHPLEPYSLAGVAPVPGGYRVTLLDRRHPEARIVLPETSAFTLLSVQYSSQRPLDSTVRLSLDGKEGVVRFDLNLLKPTGNPGAKIAPASPSPGKPDGRNLRPPRPHTANPAANGTRPH